MASTTAPMRIAIIGGGLGGAAMANALIKLPHLTVDVFEASPEFSERGAAVGLSVNAQRALDHIFTSSSAKQTLTNAGGVAVNTTRTVIGSGPKAGTLVFDLEPEDPTIVVHRAAFLRELFIPLPSDILHASKKLSKIIPGSDGGSGVQLTFEDGFTDTFDLVIGADGIFGSVRKFVLQDEAEAHAASPAGFWDSRNLVPIQRAKEALGEEYFETPRQYMWCGDGGIVLHDELDNGQVIQCIVSCVEENPTNERKKPLTRELLETVLAKWQDGPIGKGIIDLMLEQPDPFIYSQWEHKSTPTYVNGNVCIVGDAAHATTPWQGSGAGLAIEDAVVLAALLKTISSPKDIKRALKAFDAIRRPRCQRIIDSSRLTGSIFCGQLEGGHDDPEKTKERLADRWNFIFDFDLDKHIQAAVDSTEGDV